jgi:hypothetical protein
LWKPFIVEVVTSLFEVNIKEEDEIVITVGAI